MNTKAIEHCIRKAQEPFRGSAQEATAELAALVDAATVCTKHYDQWAYQTRCADDRAKKAEADLARVTGALHGSNSRLYHAMQGCRSLRKMRDDAIARMSAEVEARKTMQTMAEKAVADLARVTAENEALRKVVTAARNWSAADWDSKCEVYSHELDVAVMKYEKKARIEAGENVGVWLIERRDKAVGILGCFCLSECAGVPKWSTPDFAIRFVRKHDAEMVARILGLHEVEATEHAWVSPSGKTEAAQARNGVVANG